MLKRALKFTTIATALAAVGVLIGEAAVSPSFAQDKKPAAKKPAAKKPAAKKGTAAAKGAPKSAWVKLCEKAPIAAPKKDAKEKPPEKTICLTHHERLDGNTGMVLVSAAIREVEGSKNRSLMVMVPLGMAIPPGVRAAVYTPDQWSKAAKNEKVDEKKLKPVKLNFSLCHAAGCTAEVIASDELLGSMKGGGGLMVLAMNAAAKPIGFPVPLTGFKAAYEGKPIDNKEYAAARGKLMQQIRKRQEDAAKAYQELQKSKQPGEAGAAKPAPKK